MLYLENAAQPSRCRAVKPLVSPYWGPEFEYQCRQRDNCGGKVEIFGVFLGALTFLHFHPKTFSTFNPPSSCHFIFSFIHFMSSFTSFMVRKNCWFGAPPVYNHAGWFKGRYCVRSMCFSIKF